MIQFRRGKTESWRKNKTKLAAGQPGYDKDKHKIKIGDGEHTWAELPYASGLTLEEVFSSEAQAKARNKSDAEDLTVITYGESDPDKNTVGKIYLQYFDSEPEVDYVVDSGIDSGWTYKKWHSGLATCSGVFDISTTVQTPAGDSGLYQNSSTIGKFSYPFVFKKAPSESATVQSPGGVVWLAASKGLNTKNTTATYNIISTDKLTNSITFRISIQVEGLWR